MAVSDEKINEMFSRDIKTKTILINKEDLKKTIEQQEKEGWKLVRQTEINGRIKVTFQIVK